MVRVEKEWRESSERWRRRWGGMEEMRGWSGGTGVAREVTERPVKQLRRSRNTKYIYHFLRHTRSVWTSGMTGPTQTPAKAPAPPRRPVPKVECISQ